MCRRCTSCRSGSLFRVVYDDCYTNDYVLLRAKKVFGQRKYDIFEHNCEHSSRWCKTGIHDSVQMDACFTTAGKAALVVALRLVSLVVLWLLQLTQPPQDQTSQDDGAGVTQQQPENKTWRKPERIVSVLYMIAIGFLFFVYSLNNGCKRIRPKVANKRHDIDICGIESARRKCADVTHR